MGLNLVNITSIEKLLEYHSQGRRIKYLFFWNHIERGSTVSKACLSQWYEAPFVFEDEYYLTAEHFMMAQKAKLFNDMKSFEKILQANHPGEAKKIGREIKDFDEILWQRNRFKITKHGNMLKFNQNQKLKTFLLTTSNRILVEASPKDMIWGIGLDEKNTNIENPFKWKGLNLLGFVLMAVRMELQHDELLKK